MRTLPLLPLQRLFRRAKAGAWRPSNAMDIHRLEVAYGRQRALAWARKSRNDGDARWAEAAKLRMAAAEAKKEEAKKGATNGRDGRGGAA